MFLISVFYVLQNRIRKNQNTFRFLVYVYSFPAKWGLCDIIGV